jgi:hypothetical protein
MLKTLVYRKWKRSPLNFLELTPELFTFSLQFDSIDVLRADVPLEQTPVRWTAALIKKPMCETMRKATEKF